MELELGLKITRTRDDITSYSNLHVSKDPTGLVFLSRETETAFILIVYLKGFRRENVDININEDGSRIAVSGRKPVQQMVLMGWMMHKKDVELRVFRRVFKIPDGVILDQIKAKFSREESTLTIVMPKLVKGLLGTAIEEIKEETAEAATPSVVDRKSPEEELRGPIAVKEVEERLGHEAAQLEADQVPGLPKDEEVLEEEEKCEARPEIERETTQVQEEVVEDMLLEEHKTGEEEKGHVESLRIVNEAVPEHLPRDEDKGLQKPELELIRKGEEEGPKIASHQEEKRVPGHVQTEEEHIAAPIPSPTEPTEHEPDDDKEEEADQVVQPAVQTDQDEEIRGVRDEIEDELAYDEAPEAREEESKFMEQQGENEPNKRDRVRKKRKKLCPPLVFAGSTLIFSLIVLVIGLIRPKKP